MDLPTEPTPPHLSELADENSRFLRVDGVLVHFKLAQPTKALPMGAGGRSSVASSIHLVPGNTSQFTRNGSTDNLSDSCASSMRSSKRVKTILLLHSFWADLSTWSMVMQRLADETGYNVIAYDRVGTGLTERPMLEESVDPTNNPYTLTSAVSLGVHLLSALGITEHLILIGASSGAHLAIHMYLNYPHIVHSLVLISSSLLSEGPPFLLRRFSSATPIQYLAKKWLPRLLPFKNTYHDPDTSKKPWIRNAYLKQLGIKGFWKGFRNLSRFYRDKGLFSRLGELAGTDILFVTGDGDAIVPLSDTIQVAESVKEVRQSWERGQGNGKKKSNGKNVVEPTPPPLGLLYSTRCEVAVIARCGHFPQEERPRELVEVIVTFLKADSLEEIEDAEVVSFDGVEVVRTGLTESGRVQKEASGRNKSNEIWMTGEMEGGGVGGSRVKARPVNSRKKRGKRKAI